MNHTPSKQTLKAVRVELLKRDMSFSSYCKGHGYTRQNVAAALTGQWAGPVAAELVRKVLQDTGLVD